MNKRMNQRGFTLMELMVVIVIVAILAAVAVPLYINYVKDARRTEAKGAIAAVISAEQIYYQNNNVYLDVAVSDLTSDKNPLKVDVSEVSRNWDVQVKSASTTGFTVTAAGKSEAKDLYVCCKYDRGGPPQWFENASECP